MRSLVLFIPCLLFLLITNHALVAQENYLTLTGKIIDKETSQPVSFANVGVSGKSIGTVSNQHGEFIFKIPSAYKQDSLKVSIVGYQTYCRAIASIPQGPLTIALQLATVELDEVQVRAKGKTGLDIIKEALAAIPQNYDTSAIQMMAFYKEDTRLDTHKVVFLESVLEASNPSVSSQDKSMQLKTVKERRIKPDNFITKDLTFHIWLQLGGGAKNSLESSNLSRYSQKPHKNDPFNPRNFKHYNYKLHSIISNGERSMYVIECLPSKKNSKAILQGKMYIDVQTLAFTQFEFGLTPYGLNRENNHNALLKSIGAMIVKANLRFSKFKHIAHFEQYQGKWYLKDVQRYYEANVNSKKRNLENSVWKTEALLTITDIRRTGSGQTDKGKIYTASDSIQNALLNKDDFWGNLNIIKPTATDTSGNIEEKTDTTQHKAATQAAQPSYSNRENGFTRADTLRGKLTPSRTCYDVTFYDLDVKVDIDNKFISGSNTIRFKVVESFTRMQVDLYANMQIHKVLYKGKELPYTREFNAVFIDLPESLKLNTEHEIKIEYSGKPQQPDFAIPMHGGFLWEKDKEGNPWVQVVCQGSGASLWFPNKDHLSDEPDSVRIAVTVPKGLMNISNGRLRKTTQLSGNQTRYEWYVSYPINNYNITLNIGKYARLQDKYITSDTLTVDFYVMPYNLEKGKVIFDRIKPMLTVLENAYGKYPFPKDGFTLMESLYPMEHQSAVSFGKIPDTEIRDSLEAPMGLVWHEVSHEWWGNNVGCKDIADMWIHEAFAVYSESLPYQATFGEKGLLAQMESLPDQVAGKEPVIGVPDVNHIHYNIEDMYSKGALMLFTFKHVLNNDKLWSDIIKGIQRDFRYKTVTTHDIVSYINTKTKTDYTYFFDQYLKYTSIPTLALKYSTKGEMLTVAYKWNAVVKDFLMPVKVTKAKDQFDFIYPTTSWKTITLPNMTSDEFEVDELRFYINVEEQDE